MKNILNILLVLCLMSCKKDADQNTKSHDLSENIWQILAKSTEECPPFGIIVELIEFESGEIGYRKRCNSNIADCGYSFYDKEGVLMKEPYLQSKFVKTIFSCM